MCWHQTTCGTNCPSKSPKLTPAALISQCKTPARWTGRVAVRPPVLFRYGRDIRSVNLPSPNRKSQPSHTPIFRFSRTPRDAGRRRFKASCITSAASHLRLAAPRHRLSVRTPNVADPPLSASVALPQSSDLSVLVSISAASVRRTASPTGDHRPGRCAVGRRRRVRRLRRQ